jgi:hypothetical protein
MLKSLKLRLLKWEGYLNMQRKMAFNVLEKSYDMKRRLYLYIARYHLSLALSTALIAFTPKWEPQYDSKGGSRLVWCFEWLCTQRLKMSHLR